MATIGQVLTAPESGWKRYDADKSQYVSFDGDFRRYGTVSGSYGSNVLFGSGSSKIYFNFVGTKLRLIDWVNIGRSNSVLIIIDGIERGTYDSSSSTQKWQVLDYEITGLENKEHSVQIMADSSGSELVYTFDAIDIDESGELKPYSPISPVNNPTNLTAIPGDAQVTLNWDAVTSAAGYNVKRSTTAGGPYETITTNVSGISYVDTDVTNGTTYYYVVTAVNADGESANSNEASATPVAPINVLLRITMNDSSEREYSLTATELDSFINWFNKHTSTDDTSFMFNKTVGSQASKEYLAFNKIISFEVIPLPAE